MSALPFKHLAGAAEGKGDVAEVSTALRIVLQLEGIPCR
jgi:hypothetical protein